MGKTNLAAVPVGQIMGTPPVVISPGATVKVALQTLVNKKIAGAPIVNGNMQLVGVVSERDVLLQAASGSLDNILKYVENPDHINKSTTLKEAIIQMVKNNRKWLTVVDDRLKVVGVISRRDLLKVLLANENT